MPWPSAWQRSSARGMSFKRSSSARACACACWRTPTPRCAIGSPGPSTPCTASLTARAEAARAGPPGLRRQERVWRLECTRPSEAWTTVVGCLRAALAPWLTHPRRERRGGGARSRCRQPRQYGVGHLEVGIDVLHVIVVLERGDEL